MDGEFRVLVSHHGGGFRRSFEESKRKRNLMFSSSRFHWMELCGNFSFVLVPSFFAAKV